MKINVAEIDTGIEVKAVFDNGSTASAVVVGGTLSSVDARAEQIVENHNLRDIADSE